MSFNIKGEFPGAVIVTEYDGTPVIILGSDSQNGKELMANYGGAATGTLLDSVNLCYGDSPWTSYSISIADVVFDKLGMDALCAVLEHEKEHGRRRDKGYDGLTPEECADMEMACDAAGSRKYGHAAIAKGIFGLTALGALYCGINPRAAFERLDEIQPGRLDALVRGAGKNTTVAQLIERVEAMVGAIQKAA